MWWLCRTRPTGRHHGWRQARTLTRQLSTNRRAPTDNPTSWMKASGPHQQARDRQVVYISVDSLVPEGVVEMSLKVHHVVQHTANNHKITVYAIEDDVSRLLDVVAFDMVAADS